MKSECRIDDEVRMKKSGKKKDVVKLFFITHILHPPRSSDHGYKELFFHYLIPYSLSLIHYPLLSSARQRR
jgi:hypothetical protein